MYLGKALQALETEPKRPNDPSAGSTRKVPLGREAARPRLLRVAKSKQHATIVYILYSLSLLLKSNNCKEYDSIRMNLHHMILEVQVPVVATPASVITMNIIGRYQSSTSLILHSFLVIHSSDQPSYPRNAIASLLVLSKNRSNLFSSLGNVALLL